MKTRIGLLGLLLIAALPRFVYAEDAQASASITAAPLRYVFVQGDENKFREHHWIQDDYGGGIEEFSIEEKNIPTDFSVSVEGHANPADNDYETLIHAEKTDLAYLDFNYQEFSKFYDNSGGVYYPFKNLSSIALDRELELEIGRIHVEAGLLIPDKPRLSVAYDRRYKQGSKSRLTWGAVKEGSVTRNIAPSFQEIDQIVDSVELNESHTIKETEIKGRQYWEWMSTKSMREEQNFATTGVAADSKIRDQYQKPESHVFSTTESIERWFRDETVLAAGAYNFMTMSASEVEDIFEMNKDRVITNFGNPKQIRNARADNEYHSHAWATSMMVLPWSWLSVTPRMRLETTQRSGNSSYPSDTTAGTPDGIINTTEISQSQDKMTRMGEGISFRVTKIPRTALYNEFEFEQARNWLGEDRDSLRGQSAPSTGEIFTRESLNLASRGIWTLGGQYAVCRFADFTTQFRINRNNSDYDNTRHTDPSSSSARSAFYDVLNTQTEEFSTHLLLKPKRWLRPSVRYKVQARDYMTRVMDQSEVTTEMDSHIFTFDLSLQPRPNLLIVTGLSPQYAWISSPARSGTSVSIPRYQSNILTWLFNVNYGLTKKINLLSNLGFSKADNFNDFSSEGLPLGTAYSQVDFSAGVAYAFTEAVSVETDYSFFGYSPDERYDSSHYNASMIAIKTKVTWA